MTWTEITTPDELVALLGEPAQRARDKSRPALLDVGRAWLTPSPSCALATADASATYRRGPYA